MFYICVKYSEFTDLNVIFQNKRPRQFGSVIIVDHSKPPEMNVLNINSAPNDRHDSVQVVSSTYSELAPDNPTTGHSNTPIAMPAEVEVVSETKYVNFVLSY